MSGKNQSKLSLTHVALGAALLGAAALPFACDKPSEPAPATPPARSAAAPAPDAKAPAPHPTSAAPAPAPRGHEALAWTKPDAWTEAPNPSPMRKATYKIAKAAGDSEDAECSVSLAGGSPDANVQRWEGQFGGAKAKLDKKTVNSVEVTIVELEGTFGAGPMMGGSGEPKPDYAMLSAIAAVDAGQAYFFKVTGPKKTVLAARADFDKLVASFAKP